MEELRPDVVLLGGSEEDEELMEEGLQALGRGLSGPVLVILADYDDRDRVTEALSKGVRGILPRNAAAEEITAALVAAATGLVVLPQDWVEDVLPLAAIATVTPTAPIQALTPREIEVLGMLALGLGNKTIASKLGISEHTVKFHVSSIFTKLDVSSRTEAVTLGARLGLILL